MGYCSGEQQNFVVQTTRKKIKLGWVEVQQYFYTIQLPVCSDQRQTLKSAVS